VNTTSCARLERSRALADAIKDDEVRRTLRRIVKAGLILRRERPPMTAPKTAEQSGEPSS
jgi:hypothetical protein